MFTDNPVIFKLAILIACHLIGDFGFQSAWMSAEKGKSWEVNFYHAATYTAPFIFLGFLPGTTLTIIGVLAIFASHFIIDPIKSRWGLIKHIWTDQLMHAVVLVLLVNAGWL